jgi:broad specificity phosphatase PhoE
MSHRPDGSSPLPLPLAPALTGPSPQGPSLQGPSLPPLVLLVRHGATAWSVEKRHTGRTDVPLTEEGIRQSEALAPLLRVWLDAAGADPIVFTSPLTRAIHTARLALPDHEATVLDALIEYDYGRFEGLRGDEIRALDPTWDLFTVGSDGGESATQVAARCDTFASELERSAAGRPVVAFTHGHLSRILTARLLGLPGGAGAAFHNETASVAVLRASGQRFVLAAWNLRP